MGKILVVDDDSESRADVVRNLQKRTEHEVKEAEDVSGAKEELNRQEFDVIIADLWLPEGPTRAGEAGRELGGWLVLQEAKNRYPAIRQIAISAKTYPEEARLIARGLGVEFIPVEGSWVANLVDLTSRLIKQREEDRGRASIFSDEIIEKQIRQVVAYEKRNSDDSSPPVLLIGETGTGKGHWADELFKLRQKEGISTYFKNINCAALGEGNALLVQLFGALPGIYHGTEDVPGLFELMDEKWTVFLDEIAKTNKIAQGALLKLIDDREFQRFPFTEVFPLPRSQALATQQRRKSRRSGQDWQETANTSEKQEEYERLQELVQTHFPNATRYHQGYGYNETQKFKGRIVAATNLDLAELVRKDLFLIDLYNRLMCFAIRIPPLRERDSEYIKKIALEFVERKGVTQGIDREALALLANHQWRAGNRRELLLTLEAAIMRAAPEGPVTPNHLTFVEPP